MKTHNVEIQHVSDTAIWVAYYRALESKRPDALFHDKFAEILVGERGEKIAMSMKGTSRYTQWSVVIRTYIIDQYIQNLVASGVDTVINLGAGLDTRPYRLSLPKTLRWIEVDYPELIQYKEKLLNTQVPNVNLKRISLDLADRPQRQAFFKQISEESKKVLVITEGVIPYLRETQVAELAEDILSQKNFENWIAEYISKQVYRYLQTQKRKKQMQNAPFLFFPENWFGFFEKSGWKPKEARYLAEETEKLQRKQPFPWWSQIFVPFMSSEQVKQMRQSMGYVVYSRL